MEVKHRCNQILELGFPLGGVAKLFAQEWEGDVTVVMPATLAQFAKIIQNPTHMELQKAANQGRRCTWEKLSAIKANCGIELVLDECVSFLNRMHKQKKQTDRSVPSNMKRLGIAKRIPSWNCLARETSWGSLDEEGFTESVSHPGGPWEGPSWRTLKFARNTHDGSDSESENVDHNVSWTKVGGPLMRTASATTFIQSFDAGGEFNKWNTEEIHTHSNSEALQESATLPTSCIASMSGRDVLCNSYGNQAKYRRDCNANNSASHVNDSDADDQFCSFPETSNWENTLCKSQSRITVAEGDMLLAERSLNGTVLNVVKREDVAFVKRSPEFDSSINIPAFECIPLDRLDKDFVEDNSSTTSHSSNMDRESDACAPVSDEHTGNDMQ